MKRVVVAGLGNEWRRDDGVGVVVARRVRDAVVDLPAAVEIVPSVADPVDLIEPWDGADLAIVVDAVRSGSRPGTLYCVDLDQSDVTRGRVTSSHGLGVQSALRLARSLGRAPVGIVVVGVEGEDFGQGAGLSPAVAGVLDQATDAVVGLIKSTIHSSRMPPARHSPLLARLIARAASPAGGEALTIFTALSRHRRLFRWWLPFAGTLLLRGRLPRAVTELVVLRTGWNCGCEYVWVQHVPLAARAGLDTNQIAAVGTDRLDASWSPRQQTLLRAADELHDRRGITDRTWVNLAAELDDQQVIELCFLVGHYEMIAMTLNAIGIQPEPANRRLLPGPTLAVANALRDRMAAESTRQPLLPVARSC